MVDVCKYTDVANVPGLGLQGDESRGGYHGHCVEKSRERSRMSAVSHWREVADPLVTEKKVEQETGQMQYIFTDDGTRNSTHNALSPPQQNV
jgi:hypothetical protein